MKRAGLDNRNKQDKNVDDRQGIDYENSRKINR